MGFLLRKLRERRARAVPAYERASRPVVRPARAVLPGEAPSIPFSTLLDIYLRDLTARAAVDYLADQAVGMGFYTTAELPEAKRVVDEFCERVGLDEFLQLTAREVIAFGNSFWLKVKPERLEDLRLIPITNARRIYREPNEASGPTSSRAVVSSSS